MSKIDVWGGLADAWDPDKAFDRNPIKWASEKARIELWSKQRDILESVRDHRYTAVKSCHDAGKSFIAATTAGWWIDSHPLGEAFVVSTAPSDAQVKAILWREIGKLHRRMGLPGRITQDAQWKFGDAGELIGFGRKPADSVDPEEAMQAFQGIHAMYVLIILDEACGIPKWLWDAADALATNDKARVLAIGNPDNPAAHFEKVCRPGSGWNTIQISAFDTPAFTGEPVSPQLLDLLIGETWVNERKRRWGEASPLYASKVLGEFPDVADDTLFAPFLVERAQRRDIAPNPYDAEIGVDVARYGSDFTIFMLRQGAHCRTVLRRGKFSTTRTAGELKNAVDAHPARPVVKIDDIGIGGAVTDQMQEAGYVVHPMIGSQGSLYLLPSGIPKFFNKRAEWYWLLRERFERGEIDIDPTDDDLANQLLSIKYTLNSRGQILVESKEDMSDRGLPSPDDADALAYACSPDTAGFYGGKLNDSKAPKDNISAGVLDMKW